MGGIATSAGSKKGYRGMGMEGAIARWYARNTGRSIADYRAAALAVAGQVAEGASVLEVAPGPGYLAIELAKLGPYRVTGLDISETFVTMAAENARKAGVSVDFRRGDASAMPFEPESFDRIVCRAAFKNFAAPVRALNEMHRVLKPGGTAVILDLRSDAPPEAIRAAVEAMGLSPINALLTKLAFKHMLLKRAYSQEQFRSMASETPFQPCSIRTDAIGLEVSLTK
jgi:ubiquinone/menaquinone biosynthesis C-methylase UbiE